MTAFQWTVVAMLGGALYGFGWALDQIMKKLDRLIDIVHRIRINDHERDF